MRILVDMNKIFQNDDKIEMTRILFEQFSKLEILTKKVSIEFENEDHFQRPFEFPLKECTYEREDAGRRKQSGNEAK